MNWTDYIRGYSEGKEDGYNSTSKNHTLLPFVMQLLTFVLVLSIRISFFMLKGILLLLWKTIQLLARAIRSRH